MWFMPPEPVPADLPPDPMSAEERAAWLDRVAEQDEPPGLEEWLLSFAHALATRLPGTKAAVAPDNHLNGHIGKRLPITAG